MLFDHQLESGMNFVSLVQFCPISQVHYGLFSASTKPIAIHLCYREKWELNVLALWDASFCVWIAAFFSLKNLLPRNVVLKAPLLAA